MLIIYPAVCLYRAFEYGYTACFNYRLRHELVPITSFEGKFMIGIYIVGIILGLFLIYKELKKLRSKS